MIREALSFVSPVDRDVWIRIAFAIKSELGDDGFDIWDAWSRQADNYNEASARSTWRSAKRSGGVTIGTLYAEAKRNGWVSGATTIRPPPKADRARRAAEVRKIEELRAAAAKRAHLMILQAEIAEHPYLTRKGFPRELGLTLDGLLVVPMREIGGGVNSVQTIDADGRKKFLFGGKAKGSVFVIGNGAEAFLCEGYATGLSINAALNSLYRRARVVVCFSAANVAYVAQRIRGFVVADNDASKTGAKYAIKSHRRWWMPPTEGDANDFHMARGIRPLAEALNELRRGAGRPGVETAVRGSIGTAQGYDERT